MLTSWFSGGEGKLVLLQKTIYGLMQGGFDWYWTLDKAYVNLLGYQKLRADPCVHSRLVGKERTIMNMFNNNTFGISSTREGAETAKRKLAGIYEVKDLGDPTFILGMAVYRDLDTSTITLSQKAYLTRVLEKFSMSKCNP